ncbi:hypothetical protein TRIUR3_32146 [Triticum urartu]|uniref:Uncharacterized protein n=1 Tax=Triticum urartu TaxID=4572 RepID=M8A1K9_TRIUA|nr:hypothetical protein TRIUR3_32146 [Triticum urartu]
MTMVTNLLFTTQGLQERFFKNNAFTKEMALKHRRCWIQPIKARLWVFTLKIKSELVSSNAFNKQRCIRHEVDNEGRTTVHHPRVRAENRLTDMEMVAAGEPQITGSWLRHNLIFDKYVVGVTTRTREVLQGNTTTRVHHIESPPSSSARESHRVSAADDLPLRLVGTRASR